MLFCEYDIRSQLRTYEVPRLASAIRNQLGLRDLLLYRQNLKY